MVDASLLTDDVRALVGRTSEPLAVRVTRRAVTRAMDLYLGHHANPPGDGQPAPGFVMAALEPETEGVHVPDLMPDSILISNEWLFERELVVGDELVAQGKVADIVERFGGRFGYSLHVRSETEFRDASGAIVARSARTMMYYDASQARDGGEE